MRRIMSADEVTDPDGAKKASLPPATIGLLQGNHSRRPFLIFKTQEDLHALAATTRRNPPAAGQ